jgi:peptidoglycan DL-endopeptidase CwlO
MQRFFNAKAKLNTFKQSNTIIRSVTLAAAIGVLGFSVVQPTLAYAVDYDKKIKQLRNQNKKSEANRDGLAVKAETLEEKIASLQSSITTIEQGITENLAKIAHIQRQIAASEVAITNQRKVLGTNVKQMYIENQMSMLEQLATSKNLSHFVDREQSRITLQENINTALAELDTLKAEQKSQQQSAQQLVADQKAMRERTATDKKEVGRLLSMNKQEQSAYNQNIAVNSNKITDLQREQAAENERFLREQAAAAKVARAAEARRQAEEASRRAANTRESNNNSSSSSVSSESSAPKPSAPARSGVKYVNGRNYPWANVYFPNSLSDPWGMYKRQCVSYTAWKVSASGRHMPYWGGRGNAKLWDDNARAAGIPVDNKPRVGDVAVSNAGTYGHVMYVEAVHSDGTISISQYNASWTGTYSEARIYPGNLVFIHF